MKGSNTFVQAYKIITRHPGNPIHLLLTCKLDDMAVFSSGKDDLILVGNNKLGSSIHQVPHCSPYKANPVKLSPVVQAFFCRDNLLSINPVFNNLNILVMTWPSTGDVSTGSVTLLQTFTRDLASTEQHRDVRWRVRRLTLENSWLVFLWSKIPLDECC